MKRVMMVLACALVAGGAWAASGHGHGHEAHGAASTSCAVECGAKSYEATGVVKRVDAEHGKVTLAHDPVPSLGWPKMTMAFKVHDAKTLAALKPEQKVAFRFVQDGRDFVITSVQ